MSVKCRILKSGKCEITQAYGVNGHLGIDIVNEGYTLGTVVAHSAGTVSYVQTGYGNAQGSSGMASYGNMVKINHNNGYESWYAHLDRVYVTTGQTVSEGQEIGYMGNTGNSYGGHTHFEVHKNGTRIDPSSYISEPFIQPITPTVSRNENNNQLKVNYDDLRVRKAPATNQAILGMAQKDGIYNFYETKDAGGYTWYKIADNQWVANQGTWCTIYLKKDLEEQKMIEELNKQIEALNKTIEEKDGKIEELEKNIKELNENENGYKYLEAKTTGRYFIRLYENEVLKYKRG